MEGPRPNRRWTLRLPVRLGVRGVSLAEAIPRGAARENAPSRATGSVRGAEVPSGFEPLYRVLQTRA